MTVLIEANPPGSWQDLEARVAQILTECGYEVESQKNVPLARGDVNIDVWADDHSSPQNIIVVECKHWATPVTKSVVHSFRTVVGDSGANTGLIVSSAGFQKVLLKLPPTRTCVCLTGLSFRQCSPCGGSDNTCRRPWKSRLTHCTSIRSNYSGPAGIGSQGLLSNRRRSTPSTSIPCLRAVEM